jgi:hypothetical protein
MPLFLFFNTQAMHIKLKLHNTIAMFFLKTFYILAGFEPGYAVSEATTISAAPRRQGLRIQPFEKNLKHLFSQFNTMTIHIKF